MPGAYQMAWFARRISGFSVTAGDDGAPVSWDKVDYQTWRIRPGRSHSLHVTFTYRAEAVEIIDSFVSPAHDFALLNGATLFLYPVGRGYDFPGTVSVHVPPDWQVVTPMAVRGGAFGEGNYHDLVDMPFFIGHFDVDSERVLDRWVRFASYPAGAVAGARRAAVWQWLQHEIPVEAAVFHDVPWRDYTVMEIVSPAYPGHEGLEHQSSQVDIVAPLVLDDPSMPGQYAHEMFHAWNVKRLRPAGMWPYAYAAPQPTPWLWVSEGVTDYYTDLAQVRSGVLADTGFYRVTAEKMTQVADAPAVALTDASLSTWVHPLDGTDELYYPKGSVAGFLLDILIRDASDDRQSLDDVMRALYDSTYKRGRGFTAADWWGAVRRSASGRSFAAFNDRYVDGAEPFPYDSILHLAGLRLTADTTPDLQLGFTTALDPIGVRIVSAATGGAAATGGLRSDDHLVSIGDIVVSDTSFADQVRRRYATRGSLASVPVVVQRHEELHTLMLPLRYGPRGGLLLVPELDAAPKAQRIRSGILHGPPPS
jgi:predicted metalloprotease with PDZ domain